MRGGALGNRAVVDEVDFSSKDDLLYALRDAEGPIRQRVRDLQEQRRGIKFYLQVTVGVRRDTPEGEIRMEASFSSKPTVCVEGTDLDQDIHTAFHELFKKFEEYTSEHSGCNYCRR